MDMPNRAEGPFGMNNKTFDMDSINEVVYLNTTEIWTLKNNTLVAHPFHIHDIQFNVIEESGIAIPPKQRGWKDVVLVMPGDSVKFLTKFETFTDPMIPYMYHCHLLHHEDDGMMGSFIVIDSATTSVNETTEQKNNIRIYPNPANEKLIIKSDNTNSTGLAITVTDITGRQVYKATTDRKEYTIDVSKWSKGMYVVSVFEKDGPSFKKVTIE
jgi:blue copper oxidase